MDMEVEEHNFDTVEVVDTSREEEDHCNIVDGNCCIVASDVLFDCLEVSCIVCDRSIQSQLFGLLLQSFQVLFLDWFSHICIPFYFVCLS